MKLTSGVFLNQRNGKFFRKKNSKGLFFLQLTASPPSVVGGKRTWWEILMPPSRPPPTQTLHSALSGSTINSQSSSLEVRCSAKEVQQRAAQLIGNLCFVDGTVLTLTVIQPYIEGAMHNGKKERHSFAPPVWLTPEPLDHVPHCP